MPIQKPEHLSNFYCQNNRIKVKVSKLYVGYAKGKNINYTNVKNTIHYKFASSELKLVGDLDKEYNDYHLNTGHDTNSVSYRRLIRVISEDGYNSKDYPILVYRSLSRPYPIKRWDVIDGFHRLAILSALGVEEVEVVVCKYKYKNKIKQIFQNIIYGI
jgi:hypothetical protein